MCFILEFLLIIFFNKQIDFKNMYCSYGQDRKNLKPKSCNKMFGTEKNIENSIYKYTKYDVKINKIFRSPRKR